MKNKYGFTLAETMITLGIIGILAMIMLPALNNSQPNQEMVLLKKSYYNVSRIVSELINDEDFYPDTDDQNRSGFKNTSISDLTGGVEATYHGLTFSGNSKFCGLFAAKLNTTQGGDPRALCNARVSLDNGGNFSTPDGIIWSMPVSNFSSGSEDIYIDINGTRKGSNCAPRDLGINGNGMRACAKGKAPDRFAIRIGHFGAISMPSALERLYSTSTQINKKYIDFVREGQFRE